MEKGDQGAGEHQQAADPQRRWVARRWRLVEFRLADHEFHYNQQQRGEDEPEHRRKKQSLADLRHLVPVHAGRAILAAHQRVGDPDADDRSDQGVRTRRGETKPPGAEVPDHRGDEQREHHGETGAGADLENEFDRQQRNDAEGDGATRGEHAEEVPAARPDDRGLGRQGVGIDDGRDGVRCIVESVDEFEGERDQHRHAEQEERHDRRRPAARLRNVPVDRKGHIEQASGEHREEDQHEPDVDGSIEMRFYRRGGGGGVWNWETADMSIGSRAGRRSFYREAM